MAASHNIPSERDFELLSAYLDGELPDRERAALEQRLSQDHALRDLLDDLRNTVALVRDLPRLKAPRSFTLDPAVYGHQTPWWERLFTLHNALQLSGALGAAAAVALIAFAVLFSSSGDTGETKEAPAAAMMESQANNAEPGAAVTVQPTARQFPTATRALLSTPTQLASDESEGTAAEEAATENEAPMEFMVEPGGDTNGDTGDTMGGMSDADDVGETGEGSAIAATAEVNAAAVESAAAPESNGPPPAALDTAPPSEPPAAAQAQTAGGLANTPPPTPSLMPSPLPSPLSEPADQEMADDGAIVREGAESDAGPTGDYATDQTAAQPPETPAPDAIAAGETAPQAEPSTEPSDSEQTTADQPAERSDQKDAQDSDSDNLGWLAGVGIVMLAVSGIVFVAGRRMARRA
ncbi:MAG: zf-HC2 domain-containing protein [Anaerolineae bacterium]|nr:zf-HC2 domain-containing protein [Anaerolineae bacterium]